MDKKKFKDPSDVFDEKTISEEVAQTYEPDMKNFEESHAWDLYMAAGLKEGISPKRSAEWADDALKERRKRFG